MTRWFLACVCGYCLLSGCSDADRKGEHTSDATADAETAFDGPRYGGHLRVGYGIEPTSLDAALGRSGGDAYYWRQIYDQLVDADPDLTPRPSTSLATSWEISTEPHAITFHLREGVTFHDGTRFNAEAVKFNVERILDPKTKATPRASMTVIESIDVVDEYTVRFNLQRAWGAGLNMLADRGGVMNSPAEVAALGADYGWRPAGTGPFKVDKVITGTLVHLVRNENYWGTDAKGRRLPYLDEITIRVIRDQTVLASALRTGEIDVAYLPYKDVAAFRRDDRFQIETMPGGSIALVLAFNVGKPPLDDANLRLAVAHAINPEVINKAIFFEKVIVADAGMWPVGAWAHDPDVPRPYYDLDKAREYLAKAGKQSGFEFTAVTSNSPVLIPTTEIVRVMLKKVGISMNIEVLSTGVATERFFHGRDYPLYLTGWSRYPEPDWVASLAYKSDGYYNAGNLPRADVDALVEEGATYYDVQERKGVYRKLDEVVLGEAWYVPLLYGVSYAAAPRKVRNLDRLMGWDGKMALREIWLNE
jgi:peptide/nickel transport system substrate-binding protein|tara:strand:- start:9117 stop:10715 length:1599 start_codon:yes stop_codon:yes gene_type:complete